MNTLSIYSRRHFVKLSAQAIGSIPFLASAGKLFPALSTSKDLKVYIFSKHLQFLDYNGMSEAAAEMGFDGLDLTVRPKGHVLPERVTDDLPNAVEAMQAVGFSPALMTTNIKSTEDQTSISVIETASRLGFEYYRMGWLKYPEEKPVPESLDIFKAQLNGLAKLNRELGIHGAYQNHSGNHMGAPVWDLYQLLEDISPDHLGCQYDVRHAMVEARDNWPIGLRLMQKKINTLAIKDFKWKKKKGTWKPVNTPLGEGIIDFTRYFSILKKHQINVPVSLHCEYDLGGAEHGDKSISINKTRVFNKMKKDLQFLRETWEIAG